MLRQFQVGQRWDRQWPPLLDLIASHCIHQVAQHGTARFSICVESWEAPLQAFPLEKGTTIPFSWGDSIDCLAVPLWPGSSGLGWWLAQWLESISIPKDAILNVPRRTHTLEKQYGTLYAYYMCIYGYVASHSSSREKSEEILSFVTEKDNNNILFLNTNFNLISQLACPIFSAGLG